MLVLSEGRSFYQDFLGFVMWAFAPTDMAPVYRTRGSGGIDFPVKSSYCPARHDRPAAPRSAPGR